MVSKSKVDYFITYDYKRTGQMQATSMLEMRPTGNYALLNGNARTRNAFLLHEGQRSVLHASIKHKNICLVLDTMVAGATNDDGYNLAKYLINKVKDSIDIIITSNDAMAGGVVRALQESVGSDGLSLAERVLVSGVDADSRALRRINRGLQSTSVYNSVKTAATASARAAVLLASGTLTNDKTSVYVNNGLKNVPTLILPSILISNNNLFLVKSD
jgi:D-xylose transport system substrate-binding protein